jgi:hypothetical protein
MQIYILFILLAGPGAYGFSTEFATAQACEHAAEQARKAPFATNAFCAPKGGVEATAQPAPYRVSRRVQPRRAAAQQPYWESRE